MQLIKQTRLSTIVILFTGLLLIFYGYLCRLGLYFFWESKSIGWALLLIGVLCFFRDRIKFKRSQKRKTVGEWIGISLISFVLLLQMILLFVVPFSDAYAVSKTFLKNSEELKSQVGNITGFGIVPMGSFEFNSDSNGERGSSTLYLIVKGEKKYMDVIVLLNKDYGEQQWKVVMVL